MLKKRCRPRRSIRAFSAEPIPKKILKEILEQALRAPSWGNTQPWKLTVVGGPTLEKIREEYLRLSRQGLSINPDFPFQTAFNEIQTFRYKGLGKTCSRPWVSAGRTKRKGWPIT